MNRTYLRVATACFAVTLCVATSATTAQAQPPPAKPAPTSAPATAPTGDSAMEEAKHRFEEGVKLVDQGDNETARIKFSQAWVLLKSPAVLFNMARAEQLSGHVLEALEHYRQFTRMAQDPKVTDAQRQRATENITELSKKVGQIDVEAPAHAHVSIDGRAIDSIADPIAVNPGKHTVEATIDGKVKSISVECQAGTITKATLGDHNAHPSDPNANGNTVPGPIEGPPEVPSERSTLGWAVPITLGVLAVGGFVMGGVFASSSQSAKTDAETLRGDHPGLCATPTQFCTDYDSKRDSASSKATVAWVSYAAGGVFLIGAAATFIFWPKKHPGGNPTTGSGNGNVRVIPSASPQGAGAALHVTF